MFDNVGGKVKILAKVFCVLGIIGSVIMAVVLFGNSNVGIGILCLVAGSISSWITSLVIYAIGEAAEKSELAAEKSEMAWQQSEAALEVAQKAVDTCEKQGNQLRMIYKTLSASQQSADNKKPETEQTKTEQTKTEQTKTEQTKMDPGDSDLYASFHRFSQPVECEACGIKCSEGYVVGKGRLSSKHVCEKCYHALKGE